jgi:hypothetical protein
MRPAELLRPLLLFACALPAACTTESHSQLAGPQSALITRTLPARAWFVRDDGVIVGSVLLYSDPAQPTTGYYSVRNPNGQVLGMVDLAGRSWRYRIHEEQPEWLGTGPVAEGVRRILGTSALTSLEELDPAALAPGG